MVFTEAYLEPSRISTTDPRLSLKYASDLEPLQTSMMIHFTKIFHG